jgi:hypothetical protein
MKELRWSASKSASLKRLRGVSFEDIIRSKVVEIRENPARPSQLIILFIHEKYIWVAPCVEEKNFIFIKTLYPSRKYTRTYREKNK